MARSAGDPARPRAAASTAPVPPDVRRRTIRAVSFDLDGTLVTGTTTCRHLADVLGHSRTMNELERAYARGAITNRQVAEEDAFHYAGRTKAEIHAALATVPIVGGLKETLAALRAADCPVFLATVTWRFIADYFRTAYGFDAVSGVEMDEDQHGKLSGKVARHFDEEDKVRFVEGHCAARGIALAECAAVGDSRSDVPLFRRAGLAIAFNADPETRAAAALSLTGKNLSVVLPHLLNGSE